MKTPDAGTLTQAHRPIGIQQIYKHLRLAEPKLNTELLNQRNAQANNHTDEEREKSVCASVFLLDQCIIHSKAFVQVNKKQIKQQ